jgi:hypothetical protein
VPKRSSAVRGIRSRGVEGEEGTKPTLTRGWILGEGDSAESTPLDPMVMTLWRSWCRRTLAPRATFCSLT